MSALNDWRLALRVGVREARRSWGRSAVIVTMVATPLMIIAAALVVGFTLHTTAEEGLDGQMGSAQAAIMLPDSVYEGTHTGVEQTLDAGLRYDSPHRDITASAAEVAAHFGGRAIPAPRHAAILLRGPKDGQLFVSTMSLDLSDPATQPIAPLVEGRYPRSADEVVVTRRGVESGLPRSGTVGANKDHGEGAGTLPAHPESELTVVGVVDPPEYPWISGFTLPGALGHEVPDPAKVSTRPVSAQQNYGLSRQNRPLGEQAFLIVGDGPVTWEQVQWAQARGWAVSSRAVVQDPPEGARQMDRKVQGEWSSNATALWLPIAMGATGLVLVLLQASLMAGPAFAVGYARQRHSLALLSSNGASRGQLLRYLSGQALVLGVLTAVVATAAGVGLGIAAVRYSDERWRDIPYGPLDIPWLPLVAVFLTAVLAVLVSALFPALRMLRGDVATGLRTGFTTRRPARSTPLIGLVLAGISAAVVLTLEPTSNTEVMVFALSLAVLVISSLLLVPWLIHLAAGAANRLSAGPRLALRDLTRQRMRSVPTVGAIVGATVALVTVSMVGPAVQAMVDRDHYYGAPVGGATAYFTGYSDSETWDAQVAGLKQAVATHAPDATVMTMGRQVTGTPAGKAAERAAMEVGGSVRERLLLNGQFCDAAAWRENVEKGFTTQLRKGEGAVPEMGWRCEALSSREPALDVTLIDPEVIENWNLRPEVREALLAGRAVASSAQETTRAPGQLLVIPTLNGGKADESSPRLELPALTTVTVEVSSYAKELGLGSLGQVLLTTDRAKELGLAVEDEPGWVAITGLNSPKVADKVSDDASGWELTYEDGPTQMPTKATLAIAGVLGLLMVLASVIGAALRQSESAADDASLAAVGAPTGLRRNSAVWHAVVAGALGVGIGVLVGLVPGVALSRLVTVAVGAPRSITWPEWWLVPVLLTAIALAALAARLLVPAHPVMTVRRRP